MVRTELQGDLKLGQRFILGESPSDMCDQMAALYALQCYVKS